MFPTGEMLGACPLRGPKHQNAGNKCVSQSKTMLVLRWDMLGKPSSNLTIKTDMANPQYLESRSCSRDIIVLFNYICVNSLDAIPNWQHLIQHTQL